MPMTRSTMRGRALLTSLLLVALGAGVLAEQRQRPIQLPLLGVGQTPNAASNPTSDDFFSDAVLQEIRLDINARDWQTLKENFLTNEYYPADLRWNNMTVRNVGIRSRGNSSRSGVKPGLRVDFNRYTTGQTFLGLKSFVLRNNLTDVTSMHERLTMQLFTRIGEPAPREAFVKLFINNVYEGLYTLVEAVDKDYLRRTRGENDGYLFSFNRNPGDTPYYFDYLGPDVALYVPHPFEQETRESDPQPEPLIELIRTVAEANESAFTELLSQYLDITQFIRHVAVEVFMGDSDGVIGDFGLNNFYIYRPQTSNVHVFIPWDKSETMRDVNYGIFHNMEDVDQRIQNKLMRRILQQPDLRSQYLGALLDCANSASEAVPADTRKWFEWEIDREYSQIRDAVVADPERNYTTADFDAAVEGIRDFARRRSDIVRAQVSGVR